MDFIKAIVSKLLKKTGAQEKGKLIEYLVIIVIIGIIAVIAGTTFFSGGDDGSNKKETTGQNAGLEALSDSVYETGNALEKKLEKFLSQIEGAGKVTVMVTYETSSEIVPAEDIKRSDEDIQERDNAGGTRNTRQNDYQSNIAYEEQGGSKKPIIIKEILPKVKGVVVIASGAGSPTVRDNIMKAVQVLMDVPLHRIQVLKKG